jgi:hypothetical protein
MSDNLKVKEIEDLLRENKIITSKELFNFYKIYEPELKENTYRWRVWKLKEQGVLKNKKRGTYIIGNHQKYEISITRKIKTLNTRIKKAFPYTNVSIWETRWLNDFMIHQPGTSYIIIEVENEALYSIFSHLQETEKDVFIFSKSVSTNFYYSSLKDNSIILKGLISRAPLMHQDRVYMPKVEKLLVDLFVDKKIFIMYQGQELINIFENIHEKYGINFTTLFRYAQRRNAKTDISEFILKETNIKIDTD